jgi:EmrB/QacA subfamily drug resistance transporter
MRGVFMDNHYNGKKTRWVIVGLLLGILISSMDNTIVSTAMGTVISQLGGMSKFTWVTSAYMITCVAGMLIYGKLSDMYGRKFFFLIGVSLFITGSVLCGFAQNMTQLIVFRAFQGIGGGGITPIAFAIIFDIVPFEQRGKMAGLFGATFGISSLIGPLLGAFLTDYIDWRYIFFVNVPLGLASLVILLKFYSESSNHTKQKIDWLGATLLIVSIICFMFALELGGDNSSWNSVQVIGLFSLFVVFFLIFLRVEGKVSEPIISTQLFKNRLFVATQGVSFFYGAVFILATVYIPIYIQGVFSGSATNAGLIILPMTLGTVVGSQIGGFVVTKISFRNTMLGSIVLFIIGVCFLGTLTINTSKGLTTLFMIITGIGAGVAFAVLNMSSIHNINFKLRGSASSSVTFFRMTGMAFGLTVFGTIQKYIMQSKFLNELPAFSMYTKELDARSLLQPEVRKFIPDMTLNKMTEILADSISSIFRWSLILLTIALFFIIIMGKEKIVKLIIPMEKWGKE